MLIIPLYIGTVSDQLMITCHWRGDDFFEIYPGITLPSRGHLIIRVHLGRIAYDGYTIRIIDPFEIPLVEKVIPNLLEGEHWDIAFPLTHYLIRGEYSIQVWDDAQLKFDLNFILESRRSPKQVFMVQTKILATNLNRRVHSFSLPLRLIPEYLFLQAIGKLHVVGGDFHDNSIKVDNLRDRTQKTISWKQLIQPAYLPLDVNQTEDFPDEYYVFNNISYTDEPGLEVEHPVLEEYNGYADSHYPIKVIRDVLNFVHRRIRYVKQDKERGVDYALSYGRGDCTEFSAVFVTLLRKLGIRARLVSGMGRSLHNYWIPHAFAEVFIYGIWLPIDTVKPPKPYLQIGNRGELIGLFRSNWLDPKFKELIFNFMAEKGTKPKIEVNQKVTESGKASLPVSIRKKKPRRGLDFILDHHIKFDRKRGIIQLNKDHNFQSVVIIKGNLSFGKIVYVQYVTREVESLNLPDGLDLDSQFILLIDKNGKPLEVNT